jgi:hypothetical protein
MIEIIIVTLYSVPFVPVKGFVPDLSKHVGDVLDTVPLEQAAFRGSSAYAGLWKAKTDTAASTIPI